MRQGGVKSFKMKENKAPPRRCRPSAPRRASSLNADVGWTQKSMRTDSGTVLFKQVSERLYALADTDPHAAILATEQVETWRGLNEPNAAILKSAILIDAGSRIHALESINQGCATLRQLLGKLRGNHNLKYNLANGLIAQADATPRALPSWYLATSDTRREARRLLKEA